jgi:peptidoglycan/LPS O-acetylase OafA/YrhL
LKYFAKIDSLRFIAALMVLISHWLYYFPAVRILNLGEMGVDLFFTISGFLITLQLLNFKSKAKENNLNKGSIFKEFYLRRAFRIFPLYYLIVIVSAAANQGEIREALPWNLCFVSNFYIIQVQHWPGLFSHFWSLSVEEHFYLFWPLMVVFINNKFLPYVTLILIAFTFFIKLYLVGDSSGYFFLHVHTISCIDLIMYGCLLAWLYKNHFEKMKDILQFEGFALLSVGSVIAAIVYKYYFKLSLEDYVILRSLTGIAFTFLVGSLVFSRVSKKWSLLENKWLVIAGRLSFGIYLIHNFIPGLLLGVKDLKLNWSLEFLIYLTVTIIISAILHWGVELPIKRLGKTTLRSGFA